MLEDTAAALEGAGLNFYLRDMDSSAGGDASRPFMKDQPPAGTVIASKACAQRFSDQIEAIKCDRGEVRHALPTRRPSWGRYANAVPAAISCSYRASSATNGLASHSEKNFDLSSSAAQRVTRAIGGLTTETRGSSRPPPRRKAFRSNAHRHEKSRSISRRSEDHVYLREWRVRVRETSPARRPRRRSAAITALASAPPFPGSTRSDEAVAVERSNGMEKRRSSAGSNSSIRPRCTGLPEYQRSRSPRNRDRAATRCACPFPEIGPDGSSVRATAPQEAAGSGIRKRTVEAPAAWDDIVHMTFFCTNATMASRRDSGRVGFRRLRNGG